MSYEVISIGDGEMLYNAFQGVAMIFGSGSMDKLVRSGSIICTMIVSIRYLTNMEFPLHHYFVGIIVYLVMFVPTDTVTIEDVYTGDVRVVANVPLGVAVPMSVISTMGVSMTEMFETAFSTPSEASMLSSGGIGTGGYLNALNTLIKLRHIGIGTTGSNAGWEGDIGKTINLYIENCVMFDLELASDYHEVTRESLEKSPDLWDAMKTTFKNMDIMTYLPSAPTGAQKSCKDAYEALNTYLNDSATIDKTDRYVAGLLGITDSAQRADDKIDRAASALGIAGFESQKFMRNALLASYLKDGPSAFIMRTGQEQLNLQWASEQGMFNEIARPLMAFVEMFTVAISPIVAFLTMLGPIGMVMMVRYVQMMLWIALWGPLMAVCNLYITIVTTRALKVMADNVSENGSGLEAMINHDQLYHTLEIWLSTGGMLASSVPALSLMVVYGGSVAATNLAGKMTAGASSSVNPSRLMPDPVSITQPMQVGAMSEYSQNVAAKASGMADSVISGSSMSSNAKQSSRESFTSAVNTIGKTTSNTQQSTQRSGSISSQTDAVMSGITNTGTSGSGWSSTNSDTASNTVKAGSKESEAVKAMVNAGISAGAPAAVIGAAAGAKVMADTGASAERGREISDAVTNQLSKMSYGGNATATTSGSSSTSSNQTFSGNEEMSAQAKQFTDQTNAAVSAMKKYQETSAMTDSMSKSANIPYQDLARRLYNSGAIFDINNATENLRGKMSDDKYQRLSDDAAHEISGSSAQHIMDGDRQALKGFLMLSEADPVTAAKIFNDVVSPTSGGSEGKMSPDEYKSQDKSPEDIVRSDEADGMRAFAHNREVSMGTVAEYQGSDGSYGDSSASGGDDGGESARRVDSPGSRSKENEIDSDTGGGEGGGGGRVSVAKPSGPHMTSNSDQGHKPVADHNVPKTQGISVGKHGGNSSPSHADNGSKSSKPSTQSAPSHKISWAKDPQESDRKPQGKHSSSVSQQVDNAVKDAGVSDRASFRDQIEKGGKLDHDKFDATAALNRSTGAVGSSVGKIVSDGFNGDVKLVKNASEDIVEMAKNSAKSGVKFADNIQNSIESGVKKLTGSNEPSQSSHKHLSDNDLPPTPKD